jgi:transcriptional regulator with XRE-family HTH domain
VHTWSRSGAPTPPERGPASGAGPGDTGPPDEDGLGDIEVIWGELGLLSGRDHADDEDEGTREPGDRRTGARPGASDAADDDAADLARGAHEDEDPARFQRRLGQRLRAVRRARGLRLKDVEALAGGEVRAAVLGSYERGDRAVAVHRLAVLADLYEVPLSHLLPGDQSRRPQRRGGRAVRLSVERLMANDDPTWAPVRRLVQHVQGLREDVGTRVISVREEDLRILAAALERHPDDLLDRLASEGLLVT